MQNKFQQFSNDLALMDAQINVLNTHLQVLAERERHLETLAEEVKHLQKALEDYAYRVLTLGKRS